VSEREGGRAGAGARFDLSSRLARSRIQNVLLLARYPVSSRGSRENISCMIAKNKKRTYLIFQA
jgi:hypothetical protein